LVHHNQRVAKFIKILESSKYPKKSNLNSKEAPNKTMAEYVQKNSCNFKNILALLKNINK
jgi:hypothetical protein